MIFSNVFAWEGAIAVVRAQDKGRFGSHRFITCDPKPDLATARFLCYWFLSPVGLADICAASPGDAGRNRTLGIKKLEAIEVPLPPIEQQHAFAELVKQVERARAIHEETTTSLKALMPAVLDKAFRGELSWSSMAAAVKRPAAEPQMRPFACYVLLLLEAWGRPVSRMALEAGLMFMLNDHIRTRLLKPEVAEESSASKDGGPNLFSGLDELIHNLRANEVIQRDVLALAPGQDQKLSKLSQADRQRAAEAVKAVEALGESRARAVIASEVPDGEPVAVS